MSHLANYLYVLQNAEIYRIKVSQKDCKIWRKKINTNNSAKQAPRAFEAYFNEISGSMQSSDLFSTLNNSFLGYLDPVFFWYVDNKQIRKKTKRFNRPKKPLMLGDTYSQALKWRLDAYVIEWCDWLINCQFRRGLILPNIEALMRRFLSCYYR